MSKTFWGEHTVKAAVGHVLPDSRHSTIATAALSSLIVIVLVTGPKVRGFKTGRGR